MLAESLEGVLRAGRGEAAAGREDMRQAYLIESDERHKRKNEYFLHKFSHFEICLRSSAIELCTTLLSAISGQA